MAQESPFSQSILSLTLCLLIWVAQRLSFDRRSWLQIAFPRKSNEEKNLIGLTSWFFSNKEVRRGIWKFVQWLWRDFWILLRTLIVDGDNYTTCSYFQTHSFVSLSNSRSPHCSCKQDLYFSHKLKREGENNIFRGHWAGIRKRRKGDRTTDNVCGYFGG